jgi:hypothetical protein
MTPLIKDQLLEEGWNTDCLKSIRKYFALSINKAYGQRVLPHVAGCPYNWVVDVHLIKCQINGFVTDEYRPFGTASYPPPLA